MRVIFSEPDFDIEKNEKSLSQTLWFCNKQTCEKEVFCETPSIFEAFSPRGCGVCYLGEHGEIFTEHTSVIFGRQETILLFWGESESCNFQSEFVADTLHTVWGYRNHAVISCQDGNRVVTGRNLQSCDCTQVSGKTYIFLKFENTLSCFFWQKGEYIEFFNIPSTNFRLSSKGSCNSFFAPKISCGAILSCEIQLGTQAVLQKPLYTTIEMPRNKNFNFHTFPNYFFEMISLATLLESKQAIRIISPYLSRELASEIHGIFQFIGDFCGIMPQQDNGVILLYQTATNRFESRKFVLEEIYNQNGEPVVENIVEQDSFAFSTSQVQDISKLLLTI